MRSYIKIIILNVMLCVFIFSEVAVFGKKYSSEGISLSAEELQRLDTVMNNIKKYYYRSIDEKSLFDRAISGMLNSLDPHSAYLGLEDIKELNMQTFGKFSGIGVKVFPDHGAIRVISPIDDTPAYRAGIKAGDYIIQINNIFVRDMKIWDAVNMMRGSAGSKLTLKIIRKNISKPITITLRREVIKIKTVKGRLLEPGYGYIRLALFQEPTEKDMAKTINGLRKKSNGKLKGLILDLRNNPGGLFDSAVRVSEDFLNSEKLNGNNIIVYTKGRDDEVQIVAKTTSGELLPNVPIVVLINEGSASASEIVAGALQDHKRATIVGTRSFGKGSVQVLVPIDKTSAIKLTTALYYTPLGRSIQAKGIEPDINVEDMQFSRDQESKESSRIDESTLIDHIRNTSDSNVKKSGEINVQYKQLMYEDYQLYEALQILKSKAVEIRP